MAGIMKVSTAATLALHVSAYLAGHKGERVPASKIAKALTVSAAHLSKVLGRLARADIVRARRGPSGGFELALPPQNVNLKDIYEAIEGPIKSAKCFLGEPACTGNCMFGSLVHAIDDEVSAKLKAVRLSDIADRFHPEPVAKQGKRIRAEARNSCKNA